MQKNGAKCKKNGLVLEPLFWLPRAKAIKLKAPFLIPRYANEFLINLF
jgi:hypothetical protein